MPDIKAKTDDEIIADAKRAGALASKASDGAGNGTAAANAAIAQTVALEVAQPSVRVAGGNLDVVSKIDNCVHVRTGA